MHMGNDALMSFLNEQWTRELVSPLHNIWAPIIDNFSHLQKLNRLFLRVNLTYHHIVPPVQNEIEYFSL